MFDGCCKNKNNIFVIDNPTTLPSGKQTWLLKMAIEIVDFPIEHGDFT